MIEVRYKARLGNNLFQYCLGRILAEELGFALQADPIPGFPNTAQRVTGAVHEGPEQTLTGQFVPLASILAECVETEEPPALQGALLRLSDGGHRCQLAAQALEIGRQLFSHATIRKAFHNALTGRSN